LLGKWVGSLMEVGKEWTPPERSGF